MPNMPTSTEAVFEAIGLDPQNIYDIFVGLVGTAVAFGLWLIQVVWPFLLGIAFIFLMWHMARMFLGIGRR